MFFLFKSNLDLGTFVLALNCYSKVKYVWKNMVRGDILQDLNEDLYACSDGSQIRHVLDLRYAEWCNC